MRDAHRAGDVLIVGAGPAGASLAIRLARAGVRTILLDARGFPRSKPCGDAVSPGATPLLEDLGVWGALTREPEGHAFIDRWRIRSQGGVWFEAAFSAAREGSPPRGLAMDRRRLDAALLEAARRAGAEVLERHRVLGVRSGRGRAHGLLVRGPEGSERRLPARFVVGADGLRSRVARELGGVERGRRRRLAVVGRFEGVATRGGTGELRLSDEGVLGYAPTSPTTCNLTLVVPMARGAELAASRGSFFRARIAAYGADELVAGGELARPLEVTGPFEATPARRTAPGALLVGDAAGYFDPFTGQGVFRALLGAALAAEALLRALDDARGEARALAAYERALDRALGPSRRVQRLIDGAVSHRRLMAPTARLLRARPRLAALLADATGDRLETGALTRPGPWLRAMRAHPTGETGGRNHRAHA